MTAAVARIAERRSGIEQTKGMLMLVFGIDEPTAFDLLRWRSQDANVKLRPLAELLHYLQALNHPHGLQAALLL